MKPGQNRRNKIRSGFSLIELLVVIAVIAVLLSILLPSVRKATALVKETMCVNNLRQIGMLVQIYGNDYDQAILPSAKNSCSELRYPDNTDPYLGGPPWYELLKQTAGLEYSPENAGVLHCPSDTRENGYCSYSGNRKMMGFSNPHTSTEESYPIRKITGVKKRLDNLILIGERGCVQDGDIGKVDGNWSMAGIGVESFLGVSNDYSFGSNGFYAGRHTDPKIHEDTETGYGWIIDNIKLPFLLTDGHAEVYKGTIDYKGEVSEIENTERWEHDKIYIKDSPGGAFPVMDDERKTGY